MLEYCHKGPLARHTQLMHASGTLPGQGTVARLLLLPLSVTATESCRGSGGGASELAGRMQGGSVLFDITFYLVLLERNTGLTETDISAVDKCEYRRFCGGTWVTTLLSYISSFSEAITQVTQAGSKLSGWCEETSLLKATTLLAEMGFPLLLRRQITTSTAKDTDSNKPRVTSRAVVAAALPPTRPSPLGPGVAAAVAPVVADAAAEITPNNGFPICAPPPPM